MGPAAAPAAVTRMLRLIGRDAALALKAGTDATVAVAFFVLAVVLFPLGVGPEPNVLARIAAGVIWIAALLASLLSLERLFLNDYEDGGLDLLALAPLPLEAVVLAKVAAHWLGTGGPGIVAAPLPAPLPEPFDVSLERPVHNDCTICFEGRRYSVPFPYADRRGGGRGTSGHVQIVDRDTGRVVASHPRGTAATLVIDPQHYEGPSTPTVVRPKPLGRMGKRITELAATPVERRSIEIYAELAEVTR